MCPGDVFLEENFSFLFFFYGGVSEKFFFPLWGIPLVGDIVDPLQVE